MEENALSSRDYRFGFYTDIESESIPKGLNEDTIRMISKKKNEPDWMTEWRLSAYRHWLTLQEPKWANIVHPPIDYQGISYFNAPKEKPKSLDEVDSEILETFERLGVPLSEQKRLVGVAVDAVFDSVSIGTTHQKILEDQGIIFCSISEAIQRHPELVKAYLGSVVPVKDNYFAALNSAVFTDGS
ncbi:MAG TPA: Fe-S cluster assembly protein SufB, partial [Candidatus Omnitrophota bacterium]|nr:Fe-S cluster assembly protein SufB [Candidatus Omnitrophota bacterium]